jgi:hypothetical protein
MELLIDKANKKETKRNMFEFLFEFMENDADDFTTQRISFSPEKLEDEVFMKELERFIKHIFECVEMDSNGRGGIDDISELYGRYSKVDGWNRYVAEIYENMGYNDKLGKYMDEDGLDEDSYLESWGYYIPTDTYGNFYNSYYAAKMVYYDDDGDQYDVAIKY